MKTPLSAWVAGARPRTLPAAVVPVVVGTAAGYLSSGHLEPFLTPIRHPAAIGPNLAPSNDFLVHQLSVPNAVLALVVALGLQIGTNYVNDYADGLRGTDEVRVGPTRLVAGKLASPRAVQMAAALSFAVSAAAGLALAIRVSYWLLPIGLLCGLAGWAYTGGRHPYGYLGFGELFVFVFFGLVATAGSAYVQHAPFILGVFRGTAYTYSYPWGLALWAGVPVGLLAAALLQANNLRDIETDRVAGKKTLAVRLGRQRAGIAYVVTLMAAAAAIGVLQHYRGYALIALAALPLALGPVRLALGTLQGRSLLPMLPATARLQLAVGALLAAGLLLVNPN